jgi:tetratricopeptide (TPR) repeat protein
LYKQAGNLSGQARVLNNLGNTYAAKKNQRDALTSYQQAYELYKELKDLLPQAHTLANIATTYTELDKGEEARALYIQALPLYRQLGQRLSEAMVLLQLGQLLTEVDADLSEQYFYQASQAYNELGLHEWATASQERAKRRGVTVIPMPDKSCTIGVDPATKATEVRCR